MSEKEIRTFDTTEPNTRGPKTVYAIGWTAHSSSKRASGTHMSVRAGNMPITLDEFRELSHSAIKSRFVADVPDHDVNEYAFDYLAPCAVYIPG